MSAYEGEGNPRRYPAELVGPETADVSALVESVHSVDETVVVVVVVVVVVKLEVVFPAQSTRSL